MANTAHYTASQVIKDFHGLPRYGGAPNELSPGLYSPSFISLMGRDPGAALQSQPYLIGVLGPGAALIAAGVLIFVIFFLAYCCACCRCCGRCAPRPKTAASCTLLSRTSALVIIGCINLALVLSAISFVPGFASGLGGIVASMQGVVALMQSGSSLLASPSPVTVAGAPAPVESVITQLGQAATASSALSASVCASVTVNSQCSTFQSFGTLITDLAASVVAPSADLLSSSAASLGNTITSFPIENLKQSISLAGLCVLAIVAGVIFLQAMLLCPSRCANYSFKFLSFLSLLLSALVYIVAGVFLVVGVLGSDVCYDPYAVSARLAGPFDPSGTLSYYLTCFSSPGTPPGAVSALGLISNATSTLTSAALTLNTTLNDPIFKTIAGPTIPAQGQALVVALGGAAASVGLGTNLLSCASLDGVFSTFFNGLCGGAIDSSVNVARIMVAAASLLLIQLCLLVDFSCYHPGDATAFTEGTGAKDLNIRAPQGATQVPRQSNLGYTV